MGSACIHLIFSVRIISDTMKEFCSFLCLLLVLPGSLSECTFRDETLFDGTFDFKETTSENDHASGNDYGVFVHRSLNIWQDHKVHFTFDRSVNPEFRREVLKHLGQVRTNYYWKTCIRFWYHQNPRTVPTHHLIIKGRLNKRSCSNGGGVGRDEENNNVVMSLNLPSAYRCKRRAQALIYHEMGHVMGIMHTQKRKDRDNYVIFNENCVQRTRRALYQFSHIPEHLPYKQLDYECNSIMHYYANAYKRNFDSCWNNECRCNVLSPRPGSTCKAIAPSMVPTPQDWKLINMAQRCPGH